VVHEFDPGISSRCRITSHFSFGGRGQGAPTAAGVGCACVRVWRGWECACGCVRPDAGYMSGGLPSVRDLALGKPLLCLGLELRHSVNLVFFHFFHFLLFFYPHILY